MHDGLAFRCRSPSFQTMNVSGETLPWTTSSPRPYDDEMWMTPRWPESGIEREHDARRREVRADHLHDDDRERARERIEALLDLVAHRALGEEARDAALPVREHLSGAVDVEVGLALAGERRRLGVLAGGGRADGDVEVLPLVLAAQDAIRVLERLLDRGRDRRRDDERARERRPARASRAGRRSPRRRSRSGAPRESLPARAARNRRPRTASSSRTSDPRARRDGGLDELLERARGRREPVRDPDSLRRSARGTSRRARRPCRPRSARLDDRSLRT